MTAHRQEGALSSATIWPSDAYKKNQNHRNPDHYKSPEGAVKTLVEALSENDEKKLLAIFGPEGKTLIFSGDEVADKAGRERFLQAYQEKNQIVKVNGKKAILEIGNDAWPFPIPIVKKPEDGWFFDVRQGKEELLNRRIGKNELNTIQVCLAYVDAQREYASKDRNGDGVLEYAQKFLSDPGTKDGLYWETGEGEEQSPLGPLIGEAKKEGYKKKSGNEPTPYHGYFYKILKAQGKSAPRGAYDYVIDGRMIGGFAMVAYPAGTDHRESRLSSSARMALYTKKTWAKRRHPSHRDDKVRSRQQLAEIGKQRLGGCRQYRWRLDSIGSVSNTLNLVDIYINTMTYFLRN